MNVADTIAGVRALVVRSAGPVGFVPTMGALHEGHLSLVREARDRCGTLVMSIFVNPLQFGPHEDFDRYPRSADADRAAAERAGVDILFTPSVDEMYPHGHSTTVSVGTMAGLYEGAVRPGHFDGVATVVAKLFSIVGPDLAFFGQKDAQQLAVVRRMVADLSLPVEVVAAPTIRDPDGVALSSRNTYLSADERDRAPVLGRALAEGATLVRDGATPDEVSERMTRVLEAAVDSVDYAAVVDPDTFEVPSQGGSRLLIVAARFGQTRLIDNLLVENER